MAIDQSAPASPAGLWWPLPTQVPLSDGTFIAQGTFWKIGVNSLPVFSQR
jgi:hypothetical protein